MWGLVKSESLMSSISFLYWFISVYLANPREIIVSITLKGISWTLIRLILFPSLRRQPINKLFVHLTAWIYELNLMNGKLLMVIYLRILNEVWNCSKNGNGSMLLYVVLNSEYGEFTLSAELSQGLTISAFDRIILATTFTSSTDIYERTVPSKHFKS